MTTITFGGVIQQPTGPNVFPSGTNDLGYDNGGLFGPRYANLGGSPWTLTVTGTDCDCSGGIWGTTYQGTPSPVTDAILNINGHALNLGAIDYSEWLDRNIYQQGPGTFVQIDNFFHYPPFPQQGPPTGASYVLAVQRTPVSDGGVAYLNQTFDVTYQTNLDLGIVGVPGPELGAGLPALLALFGLVCLWAYSQCRHLSRRRT